MTAHQLHSISEVNEPPRDGEFFFDEAGLDQESGPSPLEGVVGRHPVAALGAAVAVGVIITSLFLQ